MNDFDKYQEYQKKSSKESQKKYALIVKVYLYQNEEGKVRPTENKQKEWIKGTDLGGHVTTYFHYFRLCNRQELKSPFVGHKMVI